MFSLIRVWINGWVNNGEAGDLRCYHAHFDVTIMRILRTADHRPMWYIDLTFEVKVDTANIAFTCKVSGVYCKDLGGNLGTISPECTLNEIQIVYSFGQSTGLFMKLNQLSTYLPCFLSMPTWYKWSSKLASRRVTTFFRSIWTCCTSNYFVVLPDILWGML